MLSIFGKNLFELFKTIGVVAAIDVLASALTLF
jgi:hypothetical protein